MKKDTIRAIIAAAIVLIVYLLAVLLIPFAKTPVYWVSFIFTLIAFIVVGASFYIAFLRNGDAKSRFYGFPIARLGVIYGGVQLVLSLVIMALSLWFPLWLAVVLFVIALGAAALGLISAEAVVDEIQTQDRQQKVETHVMRTLQSKVNMLVSQCTEPSAEKMVRRLAEELRYSDPVSNEALAYIEQDLRSEIDQLQSAVIDRHWPAVAELCRRASALLAERNRLCKLHK